MMSRWHVIIRRWFITVIVGGQQNDGLDCRISDTLLILLMKKLQRLFCRLMKTSNNMVIFLSLTNSC